MSDQVNSRNEDENLGEWLAQLGAEPYLTHQDLESGLAVNFVMKEIVEGYRLELLTANSAVNRVSNWNNIISELKKVGIKVSQEDKAKIINGNHDVVFHIIGRLKDYHIKSQQQTQVDISKISIKEDLGQCNSLLQLLILAIMKHFSLSPKESVALLSHDSKYLAHILAKGLKGDFRPVQAFLKELFQNLPHIIEFCKKKDNQIFFIKSVKPAVISKSASVAEGALFLFQELFKEGLVHPFQLIKDHLVGTFLLGLKRHQNLTEQILSFLLEQSKYSDQLLQMVKHHIQDLELQEVMIEIWNICEERGKVEEYFNFKGLNQFISSCLKQIKNADYTLSSMNIILGLSNYNSDFLADEKEANIFLEGIQNASLPKQYESLVFIHQLFTLLFSLGRDKNPIAPSIYKALLLKYQECFNIVQLQVYMVNFQQILRSFPSIPYSMMVEAINSKLENNTLSLSESELLFLQFISNYDNIDNKTALVIYNMVSKVVMEESTYAALATTILMEILKKFSKEIIFVDMTVKLVKVTLAVHFANSRKIAVKKKSLSGGNKNDADEAVILKSKNTAMEAFYIRTSKIGLKEINSQMEPLIAYSIIQIQRITKDNAQGLRKVLSFFGNPEHLLKKYEAEVHRMDEEAAKQEGGKKSKKKDSGWGGLSGRHESPSYLKSPNDDKKKSHSKEDWVGITQKGIEKYHKVYLKKVEKVEEQKNKLAQVEQRQVYLKRIFYRKMLDKGVEVKKISTSSFQYIYEFDEKQKQIDLDTVKKQIQLPSYDSEHEQERDVKALEYLMKKYNKVLKVYYSNYSGHHKPRKLDNFAEISDQYNMLYSKSVWKFLKDSSLDEFLKVKECQDICKNVNMKLKKSFQDPTGLDYEGFEEFILQVSFAMFTRPPKDLRGRPVSEMVEETFAHLKLHSHKNHINQQIFQNPDNVSFNQNEEVKELNAKLAESPDYILPEGYKKVVQKKVVFTHRIFLEAMSQNYKDVYEVLDSILDNHFGFNIIEPFSTFETIAKAKPALYPNQRQQEVNENQSRIKQKFKNKYTMQKNENHQQLKKKQQEDNKRWIEHDKMVKSDLKKYKEMQSQKKREEKQNLKKEKKRLEEEKKKKERDDELKKKQVQEFQQKRKEEEKKKRLESRQRRKKEKEEIEKRVKEVEQKQKRKQEQRREKQEQEYEKRKEQEQEQQKRRREERKKFEKEQKQKRSKIEEYKNKKSELRSSKSPEQKNESKIDEGNDQN